MTLLVSLILQPSLTPWSQRAEAFEDLLGIYGSAMDQTPARKWLRSFAEADFSGLPPVVTLSAERMPGLWGGYSREKNRIYLSADCPREYLPKVLLEEVGHFLDRELCAWETPGEEGARFAALVLGRIPSAEQLSAWASDEGLGWVSDESGAVLVEGAKKKSGGGGKKNKSPDSDSNGGGKKKNSDRSKSGVSSGKSKKNRLSPPADSGGGGGSSSGGGTAAPVASQPPKPSDPEFQNQQTTQSYDDESLSGNGGSTFVVSNPEDVTIGGNLTGIETIQTDADGLNLENFTQIENASLTGGADIGAGGNSLGNVITGNDGRNTLAGREGNDTLIGLGGNDSLDGGSGDDSMVGGTGSDTFVVDSPADVVVEKSGEGTDVVQASVSHALAANVEHLELTGLANINGTGNELGNLISGNSGNNLLSGLGGNDTFVSGPGQDSFDGGADTDLLKVGANFNDYSDAQIEDIENVEATAPGLTINLGDQNEGFTISGFASGSTNITAGGGSDSIIGGSGADTFSAGAGNDTIISAQNDALIDGGADADWLKIGANFNDTSNAQIANIENVEATAAGLSINLADQAEGFAVTGFATGATTFIGGSGADTFFGGSGADSVNAGLGADIILAGAGNDTLIGAENDALLDGGDNSDWLKIGANFNDASDDQIANIENVELTASGLTVNFGNQSEGFVFKVSSSGPTTFVGGGGKDIFTGGASADSIDGGDGEDRLAAAGGNDTVLGAENDALLDGGTDSDWLKIGADFNNTSDAQIANFENVQVTATGLSINLGQQTEALNIFGDASGSTSLAAGSGADSIIGGTGADTIVAGAGNDTIVGAQNAVLLDGGADTDLLKIGANFNDASDSQIANIENVEATAAGLTINLGDQTEGFTISGFSSGSTNITAGAGSDSIIGGTGADTIVAGAGNDTIVGAQNDALLDGGADIDWLKIGSSFNDSSNAQIANIENVEVTTTELSINLGDQTEGISVKGFAAGSTTFIGGSGQDTFTGGIGAESINGGAGIDSLIGGAGNDTYFVDSTTDAVTESDASTITGGVDWVIVSANSYSLSANLENLTYVGSGNATFTGNGGNNRIDASLAGNNNLSGGAGNDTLVVDANRVGTVDGGADKDTLLFVSNTGMTIGDLGFGGFTNIESYDFSGVLGNVDITIGSTAQGLGISTLSGGTGNSTLTADTTFGSNPANAISAVYFTGGAGNDSLSGNNGNDTLSGGNGNDTLVGGSGNDSFDGGAGNDSMVGGLDNDTYTVDSSSDSVVESASQGTDVVLSSITYSLGNHVESLILTGSGNLNGTGNSLNNSLTGNSGVNSLTGDGGDDFLDGQAGIDTLIGGSGNDTYVIDLAAKDTIVEDATISAGTADEIQVNGSFSIADPANLPIGTPPPGEYSGIEVLRYTGSGNVSLTGNKLANTIIAGAGADSLTGGLGADSLIGGSGNDTYVYEGSDTLVELASGGVDEVRSSEDINLTSISEVENIVLTGSGSIAAIGNSSHNSILGNAAGNVLTGGSGNDTILGNAGDDQLDGGAGTDSLIGGLGNDTYILDVSLTDQIVENPGEGTDEIRVAGSVDLTLLLAIENIVLQGADSLSAIGNASGNRIQGNAGNNSLNGGGGVDTLIGGAGDDTYFVDVSGDIVQEQIGSGNDQVISTGGSFVLPDFVENLKVNGGQGSSGTGNLDPNLVTGNLSDNSLFGGAGGEDTLVGDEGNDYLDGGFDNQIAQSRDSMVGGRGDDTYIIDSAGAIGDQTVEQSGEGTDTVQIRPALLSYVRSDQDATVIWSINLASITFDTTWDLGATPPDLGGGAQIQLYFNKLVSGDLYFSNANSIPDADFNNLWFGRFLSDRNYFYALPENFENLDIFNQNITINGLISGAGQFQPNFVYGNAAGNYIKTLDEVAVIGGFNNHIDGQGGADTMAGGLGNDTYVVDNSGDLVLELSSQGTDWIFASASCTLQGNVENLRQIEVTETIVGGQPDTLAVGNLNFHGTGNALDNLLEGNSGNNSLFGLDGADTIAGGAGNDTIDGGGGNDSLVGGEGIDSMVGGAGNDIYSVENEADAIVDSSGFDIVFSSQSYVLSTDLEVLVLQGNNNIAGWGNSNANSLVGNSVNNILVGYDGHDTLDGGDDIGNSGGGNDTLSGGAGNDYYFLRNAGDIITENSNQGTDTVFSLDNHNLAVNFENLILGGAATAGQGNAVPNSLTANATADSNLQGLAGNDTIVGLAGNDILSGGEDNDTILGGGGNDNLDGGAAVDSLAGGTGNDTYIVTAGDVVFEATGAGVDEIQSSVGFTLSDNVENLLLTLAGHENGTGNGLSNDITGNTGNNSLFGLGGRDNLTGLAGSDTLDGGDLEDSLVGGTGSDYLLGGDGSDILNGTNSEASNGETDTLTGGGGGDLFVLGGSLANYYGSHATNNYAYITDFSVAGGDKLLLRAGVTYQIHNSPQAGGAIVGSSNSYIYLDGNTIGSVDAGDNLIAAIVATGGTGAGSALQTSDLNTIGIFV